MKNSQKSVSVIENSIKIESGKVIITDRVKPVRVLFYLAIAFLGLQAVLEILSFQRTGDLYHLLVGGILAFLLGLFASRQLFFRTGKRELDVKDIYAVQIQQAPFSPGMVYLKFRLKNKTRVVLIDRKRAEEVKQQIDPLK